MKISGSICKSGLREMTFRASFFHVQRVKSLEYKMEMSLKLYLESRHPPAYQASWDNTKYKLDLIKNINKI